jgi:hypothetical protein
MISAGFHCSSGHLIPWVVLKQPRARVLLCSCPLLFRLCVVARGCKLSPCSQYAWAACRLYSMAERAPNKPLHPPHSCWWLASLPHTMRNKMTRARCSPHWQPHACRCTHTCCLQAPPATRGKRTAIATKQLLWYSSADTDMNDRMCSTLKCAESCLMYAPVCPPRLSLTPPYPHTTLQRTRTCRPDTEAPPSSAPCPSHLPSCRRWQPAVLMPTTIAGQPRAC